MFYLEYNEALAILRNMDRILDEINTSVEKFADATAVYNATMQDATAREATIIVNNLRQEIDLARELIARSRTVAQEGAAGLKDIEDFVSDGGLNK